MKVKYAVIILNYNTIEDAISAADSVKENATTDSYIICVSDNGSSKEQDKKRCSEYNADHIVTVCLDQNNGYAMGNDETIKFLRQNYEPEYYVIMNPDVLLMNKGTIEGMIKRIEDAGQDVVGGQPLVWNCYNSDTPEMQQNIRRVPDYQDICMLSFLSLKAIWKKKYQHMIYADQMPYKQEIRYRVPSGAFFIIRSDVFESIGLFDSHTFLYYEEHILGKKLERINKELLFMPQFMVRHEHGKSTGNNHYSRNKFAEKCGLESRIYYARKYLNCNSNQINHIIRLSKMNVAFEIMKVLYYRVKRA